jgi:restriction endonuclease S subunit
LSDELLEALEALLKDRREEWFARGKKKLKAMKFWNIFENSEAESDKSLRKSPAVSKLKPQRDCAILWRQRDHLPITIEESR